MIRAALRRDDGGAKKRKKNPQNNVTLISVFAIAVDILVV